MKLSKVALTCLLVLGLQQLHHFADAVKGQKIILKIIKEPCGFVGGANLQQNTQQAEWQTNERR